MIEAFFALICSTSNGDDNLSLYAKRFVEMCTLYKHDQ